MNFIREERKDILLWQTFCIVSQTMFSNSNQQNVD